MLTSKPRPRSDRRLLTLTLLSALASSCTIYIGDDGMRMRSWRNGDGIGLFDDGPLHEGDGVAASEERVVEPFESISVRGGFRLDARVGDSQQLIVHADSNLLARVVTKVVDGELRVELERGRYRSQEPLRIELVSPRLRALEVKGSVEGTLAELSGENFTIDVSGAAHLSASGEVEHLQVSIQGSAQLELFELSTSSADISISGSGSVQTFASERIEGSISGSGKIRYRGHPSTHLTVSGSGVIEAAN